MLRGDGADRDAIARDRRRARRRARAALNEPEAELQPTYELRYAGQAFELAIGRKPSRGAARGVRGRARGALRLPRPDGELELVPSASPRRAGRRGRTHRAVDGARARRELERPRSISLPRIDPGRRCPADELVRRRLVGTTSAARSCARAMIDPVELQVLTGALRAICEEMGAVLIRSAHSANIKERRDASTALFDPRGEMVMQAEHIPVHLGAMPAAVAAVRDERHRPGGSWILNDPYRGGTHLPDITVITPVFAGGRLIAFAANRAHHADVGGPTPGSMPADSRTLADEGVVIEPRVLDDGRSTSWSRRCAAPSSAAPTSARSSRRAGPAPSGSELHDRVGGDTLDRRSRRCSITPSGVPGRASRRSTTAREEPKTCSRRRTVTCRSSLDATVEGDRLILDFDGTAASTTATSTARWR